MALLIVFASACEPKTENGNSLRSIEVFNTDAFDCGEPIKSIEWKNDSDKDLMIRQAELWMGMYGKAIADFNFVVQRDSDRTNIFRGNWDHYAEPTGINDQILKADFSPDYVLISSGEIVRLWYKCTSFNGPTKGHVIVTLWVHSNK